MGNWDLIGKDLTGLLIAKGKGHIAWKPLECQAFEKILLAWMSIMDEVILNNVTLDEIKFVAFCYIFLLCHICSLLALCVVF